MKGVRYKQELQNKTGSRRSTARLNDLTLDLYTLDVFTAQIMAPKQVFLSDSIIYFIIPLELMLLGH